MNALKSNSSRWIHEKFDPDFAWQTKYAAFSAEDALFAYIRNQAEHHRQRTFKEELLEFLQRHEIEYDERYCSNNMPPLRGASLPLHLGPYRKPPALDWIDRSAIGFYAGWCALCHRMAMQLDDSKIRAVDVERGIFHLLNEHDPRTCFFADRRSVAVYKRSNISVIYATT